jgi:D-arabinono-1,4-lactone oxidase
MAATPSRSTSRGNPINRRWKRCSWTWTPRSAPFDARPHWGKLFAAKADAIGKLYERLPDFIRLVERLDPRGAFRNTWFEARVLGSA